MLVNCRPSMHSDRRQLRTVIVGNRAQRHPLHDEPTLRSGAVTSFRPTACAVTRTGDNQRFGVMG
jgi:hypothetical protein